MKNKNLQAVFLLATLSVVLAGCQGNAPATTPSSSTPGTQNQTAQNQPATSSAGKVYNLSMQDCSGFSAADAAKILGVSAADIKTDIQKLYEGNWQCTYTANGNYQTSVSFNVTISPTVQAAIDDLNTYRGNLGIASDVVPGSSGSDNVSYQDVFGVGDEALYTDVNSSLAARKGNIHILVAAPKGVKAQADVGAAFFEKF